MMAIPKAFQLLGFVAGGALMLLMALLTFFTLAGVQGGFFGGSTSCKGLCSCWLWHVQCVGHVQHGLQTCIDQMYHGKHVQYLPAMSCINLCLLSDLLCVFVCRLQVWSVPQQQQGPATATVRSCARP